MGSSAAYNTKRTSSNYASIHSLQAPIDRNDKPFFVSVGVELARPRDCRSLWSFFLLASSRLCGILKRSGLECVSSRWLTSLLVHWDANCFLDAAGERGELDVSFLIHLQRCRPSSRVLVAALQLCFFAAQPPNKPEGVSHAPTRLCIRLRLSFSLLLLFPHSQFECRVFGFRFHPRMGHWVLMGASLLRHSFSDTVSTTRNGAFSDAARSHFLLMMMMMMPSLLASAHGSLPTCKLHDRTFSVALLSSAAVELCVWMRLLTDDCPFVLLHLPTVCARRSWRRRMCLLAPNGTRWDGISHSTSRALLLDEEEKELRGSFGACTHSVGRIRFRSFIFVVSSRSRSSSRVKC